VTAAGPNDAPFLERDEVAVGWNNAGAAEVDDIVERCGGSALGEPSNSDSRRRPAKIALQSGGCVASDEARPGERDA
jgi:hypothetical protein